MTITIRSELNTATKRLQKIRADSRSIRQRSYEELLAKYDADPDPKTTAESTRKAKIVNRTLLSEACRNIFRNIRNIVKPTEISAMSKIEYHGMLQLTQG